jgi:dipeptidyl aminopeptidase/acylaminoacyl peptidase
VRKLFVFLLALMVAVAMACVPTEEKKEVKQYTMDQFLKTTAVGGGIFSPDESKLLVHSNETGIFNVYELDIATGEKTAVTKSEVESIFAVGYMPDGRVLYTADKGGNENNHIFLLENGEARDLTQGENTKEAFLGFNKEQTGFYTQNNSRDPRFFDLYYWEVDSLTPTLLFKNETGMNVGGLTEDHRYIVLGKTITSDNSDIYLLDMEAGGEPVLLTEHEGNVAYTPMGFSPDEKLLYFTTDKDAEFAYLMSYNMETKEFAEVYKADWDVSFIGFTLNGKYRVIGTNEDAVTKLNITEMATGAPLELPELPAGTITGAGFSRSEKLLRFYLISDNAPANLYLYDIENKDLKVLTDNLNPEINADDLVASELIRYKARDDMEIPAFLYKPKMASAENKVPALLWIHGGPGGQSRPNYNAEKQFLINHGYALFVVNNRGSSGYGKSFFTSDDGKHGKEPLWDCVDAKDWLKENIDWIDPEKIGIMGGSYGGYMTMAALAFEPEEFAVGVNLFGVTNWVRTLQSIPPYWESFRKALYKEIGNPETDLEFLKATSPLFHADKITKPVIVLQGVNDPRVIKAESDDMVQAVLDNGGIAEYVLFEDEGHGFTKSKNRIEGFNKVLAFLDKHLKGVEPSEVDEEKK